MLPDHGAATLNLPSSPGSDLIALRRAARSLSCLPFRRAFYEEVAERPLASGELCRRPDRGRFWFRPLGPERAEAHFLWLIRLGVLRREVDGQGLTDRIRLTPLGRSVLAGWDGEIPRAGLRDRIRESVRRHRPRF